MTKLFPALTLLALVCVSPTLALAQAPNPDAVRSDEILKKVAELDSLIQIVPLALTKEQIPPLLSAIEKVRQKQKELYKQEAKDLTALDTKVAKVVDDGVEKNVYPPRELQLQVAGTMRAMGLRRNLFYQEMTNDVFDVCKKTLNEGQLKTMEKSLKPELLEPGLKGTEMDSDARIKFFVRKIILDPVAYDVLLKMSRRKDVPETPTPPTPGR